MENKKICIGCERNRRIGKFGRDKNGPDGKRIYCRDCVSILNKNYKLTPRGKRKHEKSVKKWKSKNKERIRQYNKNYYKENKERIMYKNECIKRTECVIIKEDTKKNDKISINSNKQKENVIIINPKKRNGNGE